MLAAMLPRLLALVIAVCTAATGVLPTGGGARCIAMNRVMRADRDCCPKCETLPTTSVGTGVAGYNGNGHKPLETQVDWPHGVAVNPINNRLTFVDANNSQVREIDAERPHCR